MAKFKQHIPAFFDFFNPKEFEFYSKEELERKYKEQINSNIVSNGEIFCTDDDGKLFMIYIPKEDSWYVLGYVYEFDLLNYYMDYWKLRKEKLKCKTQKKD